MSRKLILLLIAFTANTHAANPDDLAKLTKTPDATASKGLDLSHADLRGYEFTSSKIDFKNANLSHANLTNVKLDKMDLTGANFSFATLVNATFTEANLTNTIFTHADLTNANLSQANLDHALFNHTILVGANLRETNLTKADFTCANFNKANLSKADFRGTIISSATFTNTITMDILHYDSVEDEHVNCTEKPTPTPL